MEDGDITTDKVLGFNNEKAVFPSNLNLITDSNKLYSLNLDKCIELGILTEVNKSSINAKAKKINF